MPVVFVLFKPCRPSLPFELMLVINQFDRSSPSFHCRCVLPPLPKVLQQRLFLLPSCFLPLAAQLIRSIFISMQVICSILIYASFSLASSFRPRLVHRGRSALFFLTGVPYSSLLECLILPYYRDSFPNLYRPICHIIYVHAVVQIYPFSTLYMLAFPFALA